MSHSHMQNIEWLALEPFKTILHRDYRYTILPSISCEALWDQRQCGWQMDWTAPLKKLAGPKNRINADWFERKMQSTVTFDFR